MSGRLITLGHIRGKVRTPRPPASPRAIEDVDRVRQTGYLWFVELEKPKSKSSVPPPQHALVKNRTAFQKGLNPSPKTCTPEQRGEAVTKFNDLARDMEVSPPSSLGSHKEALSTLKNLVKVIGRSHAVYSSASLRKIGSAGSILDNLELETRKLELAAGENPSLDGSASTTRHFARQIALHTGGKYSWGHPTTWQSSNGYTTRDPQDFVEYNGHQNYASALKFLGEKCEPLKFRDHHGSVRVVMKIGKYMVDPVGRRHSRFAPDPNDVFAVSIRTTGALGRARTPLP